MTYISKPAILWAIHQLKETTHPFLGITFLACKRFGLPVGRTTRLELGTITTEHLQQIHRLDSDSEYLFQPFKSVKYWVNQNYALIGLQAINTQTFGNLFIHDRGSARWGFTRSYVALLKSRLQALKSSRMPLTAIAIWDGKDREWPTNTTLEVLVEDFLRRYNITKIERRELFSELNSISQQSTVSEGLSAPPVDSMFELQAPDMRAIAYGFEPPPDADEPEGTLVAIEMNHVGPADNLKLEIGKRLTVIAGDNGLGKSFLLDVAWWAATRSWAGRPAIPFGREATQIARLSYEIDTVYGRRTCHSQFEPRMQTWVHQNEYPQVPALYVYASVDGAFSIEDDYRDEIDEAPLNFTAREIWDGRPGRMEGLVRDWVSWQSSRQEVFYVFNRVLSNLASSDLGPLSPASPIRMPGDPRMIPVINHPYGETPVPYASAGVRRIVALTYVVAWAWQEHLFRAKLRGIEPTQRLVLLVDEIDAHLHPIWQRTILPAVLDMGALLSERIEMQVVVVTHSPFVLASLETRFDSSLDALYHLHLDGGKVRLQQEEFYKHGDVSSWLTAPIFGLRYARSKDSESVLEEAMRLQSARSTNRHEIQRISDQLKQVLPSDDPFWRRWVYFAQCAGAEL